MKRDHLGGAVLPHLPRGIEKRRQSIIGWWKQVKQKARAQEFESILFQTPFDTPYDSSLF